MPNQGLQECAENGKTCPWCRSEIKGTENIVVESYRPHSGRAQPAEPSREPDLASPAHFANPNFSPA